MRQHCNTLADVSDGDLLMNMKQGDTASFAELYRRYSGRIYGNILRLVKDQEAAEELLQDVFTKLWEKRATIQVATSFQSYLFVVSRNAVYNFMRHLAKERRLRNETLQDYRLSGYQHVEEQLIERELLDAYHSAVEALPPKRQHIYRLCKWEGKSYEEVGAMLGISVATINDHIVKATHFIKAQLNHAGIWCLLLLLTYLLS